MTNVLVAVGLVGHLGKDAGMQNIRGKIMEMNIDLNWERLQLFVTSIPSAPHPTRLSVPIKEVVSSQLGHD